MSSCPKSEDTPTEPKHLPYGVWQGSFMGVNAWSNRDDGFFSGESNYVDHVVYTGFRYQCVEFARRFMLLTTGCSFASCGCASEIFVMKNVQNVETGNVYSLLAHTNGRSIRRPEPGNLIVYPTVANVLPWGHVGVISYVDDKKIGVIEQNYNFSSFTPVGPTYLDGECCVSRYISLQRLPAGPWKLKESVDGDVDCLGWMSYVTVPKRKTIRAMLKPMPELESVRSTPVNSQTHPRLWRIPLIKPITTTQGDMRAMYVFRFGTGEALVGAATAMARVVRFTLQFIFNCGRFTPAFTSLPTNPLGATLLPVSPELDELMMAASKAAEGGNESTESSESALEKALSNYFGLSREVMAAMRQEFRRVDAHMLANATFEFSVAMTETAPLSNKVEAEELRTSNPHDEMWRVSAVDFGVPYFLRRLEAVREAKSECCTNLIKATGAPQSACFTPSCECRVDFSRYVRYVEEVIGPRNGFTIITTDAEDEEEVDRMFLIVKNLTDFCERFSYPVRTVHESQIIYKDSRLYATVDGCDDVRVDFCFCFSEWADVLAATDEEQIISRAALRRAALDLNSDVVFAKPLWSYLASGSIVASSETAEAKRSEKFYDVCRRLYEYAAPKQPPELWAGDVNEFKDSCRRVHISGVQSPWDPDETVVEGESEEEKRTRKRSAFRVEAGIVNFAASCFAATEANDESVMLMHMMFRPTSSR